MHCQAGIEIMGKTILHSSKGQALAEAAIALPLILLIIFGMFSLCTYIYDRTVYLLAAHKAMDTGIGNLYRDDLSDEEKEERIVSAAVNYSNIRIFATEPEVYVENVINETVGEGELIVIVSGEYNCSLPFIGEIFTNKQLELQNTYIFKLH